MSELFAGESVDEGETGRTIVATLNETGELIDPHTAVAVAAAKRVRARGKLGSTPLIALSTAHPAKFPEAVKAASGMEPGLPAAAAGIEGKPERFDRLPNDAETVTAYLKAFAGAA
jgi:threonine synthase